MNRGSFGIVALVVLAILCISGLVFVSPISQNQSYHNFSDANTICNISNFWNVVSNIPFLVIGILGIKMLKNTIEAKNQFLVFFIGVTLVSVGSGYYHLNPNDNTLVWDRLPMTLAFMALFSAIICEYVNNKTGRLLFLPAIIIGIL